MKDKDFFGLFLYTISLTFLIPDTPNLHPASTPSGGALSHGKREIALVPI
jgi:hypothetical protein